MLVYLKKGEKLTEGVIYTYKENYICLIGSILRENTYKVKNFLIIDLKRFSGGGSSLSNSTSSTFIRYSTNEEILHFNLCMAHGKYMEYIYNVNVLINTKETQDLLDLIEQSKKLSNI